MLHRSIISVPNSFASHTKGTMKMYDFSKGDFKTMLDKMPTDPASFNKALEQSVNMNQKLTEVALTAAEQSAEVSTKWGREMLERMTDVNSTGEGPADYVRKMTDLSTSSVGSSAEYMSQFADIARKTQAETLEVLLSAGKPEAGSVEDFTKSES